MDTTVSAAQQLTLDVEPLITESEFKRLVTPQADDDGTLLWASQHKRCCVHRDRPGQADPGSFATYCQQCHDKQAAQWTQL